MVVDALHWPSPVDHRDHSTLDHDPYDRDRELGHPIPYLVPCSFLFILLVPESLLDASLQSASSTGVFIDASSFGRPHRYHLLPTLSLKNLDSHIAKIMALHMVTLRL